MAKQKKLDRGQQPKKAGDGSGHCYILNEATGYRLSWILDEPSDALNVTVSAPATSASTWIALGFRPKGRTHDESYAEKSTGRHTNFGMLGADIVAGSVAGGVRKKFAELYTGPPVSSTYLDIVDYGAALEDGRITVTSTRPLLSGFLYNALKDNTATILSPDADIIWAIRSDDGTGVCDYHDNARGYRFIDWSFPETHLAENMKCG